MDFKVLSRTAEADVRAFASAARQKLVRHQIVSVGWTGNYRWESRLRITTRGVASQKPARELVSVQCSNVSSGTNRSRRVCCRNAVPWISEGGKCSHLGTMSGGRTQERSITPPPLNGDQRSRPPGHTAHPDSGLSPNPGGPSRSKPHPTAARTPGLRQPQLPSHAIHPAAGNHV